MSGTVRTPDGRGLRNASVVLTNSQGLPRMVTTSSFGSYSFDDLLIGETYTVRVDSRRYRFAQRSVSLSGDLSNVDFVGLE
ncbi:MAG: carboxypeptidase-like regulatory domain-containing protein [Pyrinomonadaceae bacterium]